MKRPGCSVYPETPRRRRAAFAEADRLGFRRQGQAAAEAVTFGSCRVFGSAQAGVPSTSPPSVGRYARAFHALASEYDIILSIHISQALSGSYHNALAAAILAAFHTAATESRLIVTCRERFELPTDPEFQNQFMLATSFPHMSEPFEHIAHLIPNRQPDPMAKNFMK